MIRSVEPGNEALLVAWDTGGESRFPYMWLRDNCRCARCRDPRNGQRLFDALDLPAEPRPAAAAREADGVLVRWSGEEHESRYAGTWLAAQNRPALRGDNSPRDEAKGDAGEEECLRRHT